MTLATPTTRPVFDALRVRQDFPILSTLMRGKPLVYLDNAATTQKPRPVIDAEMHYYELQNANIHRGVYELSQVATDAYEAARKTVARFLNAADPACCIFTRGTTEAINLVASCYGRIALKAGDEVLISHLEHHSNIVPWQMACDAAGAKLRVIPINDAGELDMAAFEKLLSPRTKIVSVNHVSNSLGTINPVEKIISLAHAAGAKVLIDGAQWVAHGRTDVQALDADFYAFSGHKLYGSTGIGVLYGKRELLEAMPPYQGGGDMIKTVRFEKTEYADLPNKYEAGTPNIAGAVGLAAAIDYVASLNLAAVAAHEHDLLTYATERIGTIAGVRVIGTAAKKASVLSFVVTDPPVSSMDIGTRLDTEGVAVRTGHHCCMPVMERFGIDSTTRASFALYNTREDVDAFIVALRKIVDARTRRVAAAPAAGGPALAWAEAAAKSPAAAADKLAEDFALFEDAAGKNELVLELGSKLPGTFELLKKLTPRVQGCMSEVYLIGRARPGTTDTFEFIADANADIVRGLIALLQKLYSGQRAADVLAFDIEGFFRRIGLDQFITSQRRNGLAGMIAKIRAMAGEIGKSNEPRA
jgi:cysteine desulfurase / selenocysteine lyase